LAEAGIAELQRYVDTLIVIPNQNLFRVANERTTFADAFGMADQVLHSGVRSITDLMILPGLINLDFADVRAVMSEMGKAMMGTGEASGDDRALLAAQNAIANPLLDETSLKGAKAVLVNITGGLDMTLLEVDEAANAISAEVDGDANIIFGAAFDPALDGKIRVSVVATGMDEVATQKLEPAATRQPAFHDPRRTAPAAPAARAEPTYAEPVRREPAAAEAYRAPEPAPVVPTFQAPEPVARTPEPVIHVAEETRSLDPIVDPWVEAFEQDHGRLGAAQPVEQGDLYFDRAPAAAAPQAVEEPAYDDRDHRKSGWSLFGKKPRAQTAYAPAAPARPQPQLRQTAQPAPEPTSAEDDLEIPSFLRRLAN
ncbi:MAG: cell division protein FtsZ, partial [Alphaproteobacteria bacterium]|nr:cell division protein FtsZ [Alphaproteobacteria bacterium]